MLHNLPAALRTLAAGRTLAAAAVRRIPAAGDTLAALVVRRTLVAVKMDWKDGWGGAGGGEGRESDISAGRARRVAIIRGHS